MFDGCIGPTIKESIAKIRSKAVSEGFGIKQAKKKQTKNGWTFTYRCECSMTYKSQKVEGKKTRKEKPTKKCNCPFKMSIKGSDNDHHISVDNPSHNHPLNQAPFAWNSSRLKSDKMIEELQEHFNARTKPKQLELLWSTRAQSDRIRPKDYQNYIAKLKKSKEKDRTPLEIISELAVERGWSTEPYRLGDLLLSLFFISPKGKEYLQTNGSFLSLDATYKTNRHNYHLLQITGLAPTGQPIPIAYSFLSNENVDQFGFALRQLKKHVTQDPLCVITDKDAALRSALRTVFPHTKLFLCRWHALNSIYVKARDFFDHETSEEIKGMCANIMHAESIEKCEKAYAEVRERFQDQEDFILYLHEHWWKIRETVCQYSMRHNRLFGKTTTGLTEGSHAALKAFLGTGRFKLDTLFHMIHRHDEIVYNRVRDREVRDAVSIPPSIRSQTLFSEVVHVVSSTSLTLLKEELEMVGECDHHLRLSFGLPCRCELRTLLSKGASIHLDLLDKHWRLHNHSPTSEETLSTPVLTDLSSVFDNIRSVVVTSPEDEQQIILAQLHKYVDELPSVPSLLEPEKGKRHSKKRIPSSFEVRRSQRIVSSVSSSQLVISLRHPEKKKAQKASKPVEKASTTK
ncbi:putative MULE transposase domain protein [Blattamonas nauphoetae]|uniref:MULE transposase domain protein n=1 Tax=Blattamonas nauphoetae TaxID=2049346 RepID=A0ABQ9XGA5_9EUKA|nr:putative MULE transposase domain protein [Blattamonas nauphoetae]